MVARLSRPLPSGYLSAPGPHGQQSGVVPLRRAVSGPDSPLPKGVFWSALLTAQAVSVQRSSPVST